VRGARRIATVGCAALALVGLIGASPRACAEPDQTVEPPPVIAAPPSEAAAEIACADFNSALDVAASQYSDFADVTSGDQWSYRDPEVSYANTAGRTALREAAGAVFEASGTTGLQPEIAGPMKRWSVRATRLLLVMGLRGGNDSTNDATISLNRNTEEVQMACAAVTSADQ
jgi:hypothetical protein